MKRSESSVTNLLFFNFNQEAACISVGTRQGFAIYNCEPFGKCFQEDIGGIGIAEMLYCTSLVALVGAGDQPAFSPRRLRVWNTKTGAAICDLNFVTAVLAVRMNRQRLVAVLERKIYIFDISTMKILETLDTSPNPKALCALSPHDNGHLAFPSGASPGEIVLYDANNLSVLNAFQAHRTAPVAMAFNLQGTLLATASESGTLIRVFGVPSGKKIAAFRRGSYGAQVYCLAFNESSTILCASSDTGTIHFFSLTGAESSATGSFGHFTPITSTLAVAGSTFGSTVFGSAAAPPSPIFPKTVESLPGVSSMYAASVIVPTTRMTRTSPSPAVASFDDVAAVMSGYLPSSFAGIAEGTRDFAYARLLSTGVPNQCAIHGPRDIKNPDVQLYVATADGYFYEYSLNLAVGGKCKLERENVLRDSTSEEIEAAYIS
ncbi:unnamed protein product [Peronospora destructor]|uniref:Autophagy-related protein 18 n=1 Tax=Peronospora destructor TaxID=86335 RepID=A0AAV0T5R6_9STRA|nr:unnamed protein product [Peronospora destructor]